MALLTSGWISRQWGWEPSSSLILLTSSYRDTLTVTHHIITRSRRAAGSQAETSESVSAVNCPSRYADLSQVPVIMTGAACSCSSAVQFPLLDSLSHSYGCHLCQTTLAVLLVHVLKSLEWLGFFFSNISARFSMFVVVVVCYVCVCYRNIWQDCSQSP